MYKYRYIMLLCSLLAFSVASADTIIPGGDVSGVWDITGSPYIIQGSITVQGDDTLTIEPGVEIRFDQDVGFNVNGYLFADGTIQPGMGDTIRFTSNLPNPQPGDWDGVMVWPDGSADMLYCALEYGTTCVSINYVSFTDCRLSFPLWGESDHTYIRCQINADVTFSGPGYFVFNECCAESSLVWEQNGSGEIAATYIGQDLSYGAYYGMFSIIDCEIGGNLSYGGPNCDVTITNCIVHGDAGGGSNAIFDGCTFYGGFEVSEHGEVFGVAVNNSIIYGLVWVDWGCFDMNKCLLFNTIELHGPREVNILYNSIYGVQGNGISIFGGSNYETYICHNIISSCSGYGIYYDAAFQCWVGNNVMWNNSLGNYYGISGSLIDADPQFVDPVNYDLSLQRISPCIDAGSIYSPLDPDSTRADIGALYFHQDMPVKLTLSPEDPPIVVPETGGEFNFNIEVTNRTDEEQTFDFWSEIELPGWGSVEILSVTGLSIAVSDTIDRNRMQQVPDFAPAGVYTYLAYVGTYPWIVDDYYYFYFEKESGDQGGALGTSSDWVCIGEGFDDWSTNMESESPSEFNLFGAYPNPFNTETVISYQLSDGSDRKDRGGEGVRGRRGEKHAEA